VEGRGTFIISLFKYLLFEMRQYFHIHLEQYNSLKSPEVMFSKLRVLTHSIDKGLYAPTRKSGRGYNKYTESKKIIKKLSKTHISSDPAFIWACEKVKEYENTQLGETSFKGKSLKMPNFVESHKIEQFISGRRSVRTFKDKAIKPSILSKIVDAARWAPNSCCRQSVYFYISTNQEKNKKCMKLTPGATCFGENIPCFICVCGDKRFYPLIDKILLYIDGALAVENLLLAAHSHGIEGTVLNWRSQMLTEEKALRKILKISSYHSIIVNIALGYPEFMPATPKRIELKKVWTLIGDE